MKTILSLVLPVNATWRYINKGRKAIGFESSMLKTRTANSVEKFVPEVLSYADQTAANAAEAAQVLYYNVSTGKFMVTTA